MKKIYYKDIDLSKRDYEVINNKKKYLPLNVFIYENDAIKMLDDLYKFYSKALHDLHLMYKNNKGMLNTNNDYISYGSKKSDILSLKSSLKRGSYKNYIIEFDKKYNEQPNRDDFTEILYYLSLDGYVPHIDTLEII